MDKREDGITKTEILNKIVISIPNDDIEISGLELPATYKIDFSTENDNVDILIPRIQKKRK